MQFSLASRTFDARSFDEKSSNRDIFKQNEVQNISENYVRMNN